MLTTIAILAALLLVNALLAMSELAIMTSRQARLERSARGGSRGAGAALALSREPARFLSTVQVGITLIGIVAGAFGEQSIAQYLREWFAAIPALAPRADLLAFGSVVLVITFLSLVLGELVPKRIALAYPEQVASVIALPLKVVSVLAAPPVWVLTKASDLVLAVLRVPGKAREDVSEEDVRAMVARAASSGVFHAREHELFQRAFSLDDIQARSLMVPRADVLWIDESMQTEDVRVLLGTSPFSHYPVCRGSFDEVIGVVHIKDLIAYGLLAGTDFRVATVAQPPLYVPETSTALKVLQLFKEERTHLAFVVDEYGSIQGIVTLNDVVTALLGEVLRHGEASEPDATRRADGSWLVEARMPLHELVRTLAIEDVAPDELHGASTAAGLLIALLGRLPRVGESVVWRGWRIEVVDMDQQRIDKLLVSPAARVGRAGGGP